MPEVFAEILILVSLWSMLARWIGFLLTNYMFALEQDWLNACDNQQDSVQGRTM